MKKNIKILLIAPVFMPVTGGASISYYEIAKRIPNITVIAPEVRDAEEFDKKQKFKIHRVKNLYNVNASLPTIIKVWSIARKEKPDVIFFGHAMLSNLGYFFKKILRYKCALFGHGEEICVNDWGRMFDYFRNKFIRSVNSMLCRSNFLKNELTKKGAKDITIVYPGVDSKALYPTKKDKKLLNKLNAKNKKIILTFSRIEPRKNHEGVIRSLPHVIKHIPDILYLIVGTGEDSNLKKLVKKLKLEKYVKFIGFVPEKDKIKYYNLCDLFVMPNITLNNDWTEGFGIVFLEANACGKPVIGGYAGGVPDAIKNGYNGFLVDGNKPKEITDKIIKILKDKKLKDKLNKQSREWSKKFTYKKQAEQFLNVCTKIANKK